MYEVKDRIFTKKFIDILTYAIEQDSIDIDNESTIRIDVFNDIKITMDFVLKQYFNVV